MNVNVFAWIREGVKQSVLLGVSDALETLGKPEESDDMQERLLTAIRQGSGHGQGDESKRVGDTPPRKRLGRSLKDIEGSSAKAA